MEECYKCGFWNSEYGACECPTTDRWYACPLESSKAENQKQLEDYLNWLDGSEGQ